ncbi:MAG: DUF4258 domain-containing protein [Hahellaceae bacterium]|nr:DUF4258 domain-containing protein [Hahellaceae bacterium]
MNLVFRSHAIKRMFERGITAEDVRQVLMTGKTIMDYPQDTPYPSCLKMGWRGDRPIHVVAANTDEGETIVITAYEPDPAIWEPNFERKRQ